MAGPVYLYYYYPQRNPGSDGQILAIPAPGGGVYPVDPATGQSMGGPGGASQAPVIPVMLPAWTAPPPDAKELDYTQLFVVDVNATTGDADAIAGSTVLAASACYNMTGVTVSKFSPTSLASSIAVFTYNATTRGVFTSLGLSVNSARGRHAVRFSVQVAGNTQPGVDELSPETALEVDSSNNVFIPFQANAVVTINARNTDLYSGFLCKLRLRGWRYA